METSGCKSSQMGPLHMSFPAQEGGLKVRGSASPCMPAGCREGVWVLQLALGMGVPWALWAPLWPLLLCCRQRRLLALVC